MEKEKGSKMKKQNKNNNVRIKESDDRKRGREEKEQEKERKKQSRGAGSQRDDRMRKSGKCYGLWSLVTQTTPPRMHCSMCFLSAASWVGFQMLKMWISGVPFHL